ncbi:MAG: replication factor C small subunit [Candidatus Asgardarchaeia archaeon]
MSEVMWTEKYRPKTLDEIVNQEEIVNRLKAFVKEKNVPHMLFAGPPGTGKTTAILAFVHDLYGENWRRNYLELNASDERKIEVIRTTVKQFASTLPFGDVPFKIIVLDEADNLTSDSQQALRRIMEQYADTCRFCLTCNYSSKIIEPIQSRCAIFRFTPLKEDDMKKRLRWIAEQENVNLTEDGLDAIIYAAEGDMRRAINILQATAAISKEVNADSVFKIVGRARPQEIREMLQLALSGRFMDARDKLYGLLIRYGLSALDVIRQVQREVFKLPLDERVKVELIDYIGEVEFRLAEGADSEIQLSALLARFAVVGSKVS